MVSEEDRVLRDVKSLSVATLPIWLCTTLT